jgi:hypothetical protein
LLACLTDYPPTFWITALFFALYLFVEGYGRFVARSSQ